MVQPPRHQQASVVFGYDNVDYVTSNTSMQAATVVSDRTLNTRADGQSNKECHVVFGVPGQKREFVRSSTQADPTGEVHMYTAKLNPDAKKMLLKTSSSFGTDAVNYTTSTQIATHWSKAAAQESIALRNQVRKKTGPRPTRGMSFDDEVDYVSEAKSQYENKFRDFKPSLMAEAVKNDLRATHFALGHDKQEYSTSSHIARLSKEDFAKYATRQPPLHDLKKSTVEIT